MTGFGLTLQLCRVLITTLNLGEALMTETQKFIIVVAIIVLKNLFFLSELVAMLSAASLQKQLPLPINWLPQEVSQSSEDNQIDNPENKDGGSLEQHDQDPDVSNIQCAICISCFKVGDALSIFSQCRHGFHIGCIIPWLAASQLCPYCNQSTSDMRILVLTKAQAGIPLIIVQGEQAFRAMLAKLGGWGKPLVHYFNALPAKKKAFYSIMSVLGIVLVSYLAYKWWTSDPIEAGGGNALDVNPELVDLAISYQSSS